MLKADKVIDENSFRVIGSSTSKANNDNSPILYVYPRNNVKGLVNCSSSDVGYYIVQANPADDASVTDSSKLFIKPWMARYDIFGPFKESEITVDSRGNWVFNTDKSVVTSQTVKPFDEEIWHNELCGGNIGLRFVNRGDKPKDSGFEVKYYGFYGSKEGGTKSLQKPNSDVNFVEIPFVPMQEIPTNAGMSGSVDYHRSSFFGHDEFNDIPYVNSRFGNTVLSNRSFSDYSYFLSYTTPKGQIGYELPKKEDRVSPSLYLLRGSESNGVHTLRNRKKEFAITQEPGSVYYEDTLDVSAHLPSKLTVKVSNKDGEESDIQLDYLRLLPGKDYSYNSSTNSIVFSKNTNSLHTIPQANVWRRLDFAQRAVRMQLVEVSEDWSSIKPIREVFPVNVNHRAGGFSVRKEDAPSVGQKLKINYLVPASQVSESAKKLTSFDHNGKRYTVFRATKPFDPSTLVARFVTSTGKQLRKTPDQKELLTRFDQGVIVLVSDVNTVLNSLSVSYTSAAEVEAFVDGLGSPGLPFEITLLKDVAEQVNSSGNKGTYNLLNRKSDGSVFTPKFIEGVRENKSGSFNQSNATFEIAGDRLSKFERVAYSYEDTVLPYTPFVFVGNAYDLKDTDSVILLGQDLTVDSAKNDNDVVASGDIIFLSKEKDPRLADTPNGEDRYAIVKSVESLANDIFAISIVSFTNKVSYSEPYAFSAKSSFLSEEIPFKDSLIKKGSSEISCAKDRGPAYLPSGTLVQLGDFVYQVTNTVEKDGCLVLSISPNLISDLNTSGRLIKVSSRPVLPEGSSRTGSAIILDTTASGVPALFSAVVTGEKHISEIKCKNPSQFGLNVLETPALDNSQNEGLFFETKETSVSMPVKVGSVYVQRDVPYHKFPSNLTEDGWTAYFSHYKEDHAPDAAAPHFGRFGIQDSKSFQDINGSIFSCGGFVSIEFQSDPNLKVFVAKKDDALLVSFSHKTKEPKLKTDGTYNITGAGFVQASEGDYLGFLHKSLTKIEDTWNLGLSVDGSKFIFNGYLGKETHHVIKGNTYSESYDAVWLESVVSELPRVFKDLYDVESTASVKDVVSIVPSGKTYIDGPELYLNVYAKPILVVEKDSSNFPISGDNSEKIEVPVGSNEQPVLPGLESGDTLHLVGRYFPFGDELIRPTNETGSNAICYRELKVSVNCYRVATIRKNDSLRISSRYKSVDQWLLQVIPESEYITKALENLDKISAAAQGPTPSGLPELPGDTSGPRSSSSESSFSDLRSLSESYWSLRSLVLGIRDNYVAVPALEVQLVTGMMYASTDWSKIANSDYTKFEIDFEVESDPNFRFYKSLDIDAIAVYGISRIMPLGYSKLTPLQPAFVGKPGTKRKYLSYGTIAGGYNRDGGGNVTSAYLIAPGGNFEYRSNLPSPVVIYPNFGKNFYEIPSDQSTNVLTVSQTSNGIKSLKFFKDTTGRALDTNTSTPDVMRVSSAYKKWVFFKHVTRHKPALSFDYRYEVEHPFTSHDYSGMVPGGTTLPLFDEYGCFTASAYSNAVNFDTDGITWLCIEYTKDGWVTTDRVVTQIAPSSSSVIDVAKALNENKVFSVEFSATADPRNPTDKIDPEELQNFTVPTGDVALPSRETPTSDLCLVIRARDMKTHFRFVGSEVPVPKYVMDSNGIPELDDNGDLKEDGFGGTVSANFHDAVGIESNFNFKPPYDVTSGFSASVHLAAKISSELFDGGTAYNMVSLDENDGPAEILGVTSGLRVIDGYPISNEKDLIQPESVLKYAAENILGKALSFASDSLSNASKVAEYQFDKLIDLTDADETEAFKFWPAITLTKVPVVSRKIVTSNPLVYENVFSMKSVGTFREAKCFLVPKDIKKPDGSLDKKAILKSLSKLRDIQQKFRQDLQSVDQYQGSGLGYTDAVVSMVCQAQATDAGGDIVPVLSAMSFIKSFDEVQSLLSSRYGNDLYTKLDTAFTPEISDLFEIRECDNLEITIKVNGTTLDTILGIYELVNDTATFGGLLESNIEYSLKIGSEIPKTKADLASVIKAAYNLGYKPSKSTIPVNALMRGVLYSSYSNAAQEVISEIGNEIGKVDTVSEINPVTKIGSAIIKDGSITFDIDSIGNPLIGDFEYYISDSKFLWDLNPNSFGLSSLDFGFIGSGSIKIDSTNPSSGFFALAARGLDLKVKELMPTGKSENFFESSINSFIKGPDGKDKWSVSINPFHRVSFDQQKDVWSFDDTKVQKSIKDMFGSGPDINGSAVLIRSIEVSAEKSGSNYTYSITVSYTGGRHSFLINDKKEVVTKSTVTVNVTAGSTIQPTVQTDVTAPAGFDIATVPGYTESVAIPGFSALLSSLMSSWGSGVYKTFKYTNFAEGYTVEFNGSSFVKTAETRNSETGWYANSFLRADGKDLPKEICLGYTPRNYWFESGSSTFDVIANFEVNVHARVYNNSGISKVCAKIGSLVNNADVFATDDTGNIIVDGDLDYSVVSKKSDGTYDIGPNKNYVMPNGITVCGLLGIANKVSNVVEEQVVNGVLMSPDLQDNLRLYINKLTHRSTGPCHQIYTKMQSVLGTLD